MKRKISKIFPIAFGILVLGLLAYPQIRESGVIQGNVTDTEGIALPGVTVTVESTALIGGPRSRVTDTYGFYKFPSLAVGIYSVKAGLAGFNTMVKEGIRLVSETTLTCDFKMIQATVAEEVIVVAEIPTIDIKSSRSGTFVMTDELLLAIPGKSFEGIMTRAPGVNSVWKAFGAGPGTANTYQFDGVSLFDPRGGSGLYHLADYNIVKEVTVQSLGLPAEYGHFTGTVMTAVSKSGSNKFSTLEEVLYNGTGWNSQNRHKVPIEEWRLPSYADVEVEVAKYYDLGAQFGGKIIHDKLWFFISGEYNQTSNYLSGTQEMYRKAFTPRFFAKLTYQLNPSNKFNFSGNYFRDRIQDVRTDVLANNRHNQGWFANASWTSIFSPTTFLEAKFGYKYYDRSSIPSAGKDVVGKLDLFTYTRIDNYDSWTATRGRTYDANLQFNHYISEFIRGSHDLKVGTQYIHQMIYDFKEYCGGYTIDLYDGENYRKREGGTLDRDHYTDKLNVFAQDRWSITKRLTLNIGARFDHYRYKIPAPDRGVVYKNWNISPRVGFTYDLLGDRKNIVKLHYAHYYGNINYNSMASFESRYAGGATYYWDAATGDWGEPIVSAGYIAQLPTKESDLAHPWIWEISGGFERELFRDASLSINFYNKVLGSTYWITDLAYEWEPYDLIDPGPDGYAGTADDGGVVHGWNLSNPRDPRVRGLINPKKGTPEWLTEDPKWYSRGIEIRFTKRFSRRWQMMASYMYMRCKGNADGTSWGYIARPNRLINSYGWREMRQPHQFKLQGSVTIPYIETIVGVYAWVMSGIDLTPYFTYRFPNNYESRMRALPWGSVRADMESNVDIRVQKIFNIMGGYVSLMVDINNVTNTVGTSQFYTNYGPNYEKRYSVNAPRTYRIGFRIVY